MNQWKKKKKKGYISKLQNKQKNTIDIKQEEN